MIRHVTILMMVISMLAEVRLCASQVVRTGQVAHLVVSGDLDSRRMTDELIAWLERRDAARESLVLLEFDAIRARPDEATRIAQAVSQLKIETVVHFGVREPVAPGVLMIAMAADRAFVGRGGVAGDQTTELPQLCDDASSGWRGKQERFVSSILERHGHIALLADVLIPPLGPLYVNEHGLVTREMSGEQIVWLLDADTWRVRLSREQIVALGFADPADVAGQVFRAMDLRVARRDRTELKSGLRDALGRAGSVRDDLRTELARLEGDVKAMRSMTGRARTEHESVARGRLATVQVGMETLSELIADYPELLRLEPPWLQFVPGSIDERIRRWSREVETIGKKLDELRVNVEAMGVP